MTSTSTLPLTANAVLFGAKDPAATIAKSLHTHGSLSSLGSLPPAGHEPGGAMRAVEHEVAATLAKLTDIDLVDVLAAGWRAHTALVAAALRTAGDPDSEEVVDLAAHRITAVHHPCVDLYVDDVHLGTVRAELRLVVVIACVVAVVRDGALVAARSGRCDATASLAVEGVPLASRTTRVDLGAELPLPHAVPLLPPPPPMPRQERAEDHRRTAAPGD